MIHTSARSLLISISALVFFGLAGGVQAASLYDLDDYPAVARLVGQITSRQVGSDIAAAGDIDGDGYGDFIVG